MKHPSHGWYVIGIPRLANRGQGRGAHDRRLHAFTLVELMIVVAILALLVTIALPALAAARQQAQTVVCSARLRECFRALHMYTEDNRDWLPYMGSYFRARKFAHPQEGREWPTAIARYLDNVWEVHRCPSDLESVEVRVVDGELQRIDPTAPADAPDEAGVQRAFLSFRGEERRRARLAAPNRPNNAILLIEGMTHVPRNKPLDHFHSLIRPGVTNPEPHESFLRHREASHFLFYDGSIERIAGKTLARLQTRHRNAELPSIHDIPR